MLKKQILLAFGLVSLTTFAQPNGGGGVTDDQLQLNTITTALPFMHIAPDSRAGAMGEAGTALSASSMSTYWNTSMLIFAENDAELGLSYVPWLRQLTNDIHLSYLSGYTKISDRHVVGGALRFFNLGEIVYTDGTGQETRRDKPSEWEITGSYGFKLSERMSIGLNGKFAYSNLTGGVTVGNSTSRPAIAGASDLSFTYRNPDARLGGSKGTYVFATTINNVGNKVSYSELAVRDFIPMNLKIANAYTFELDAYNKLTWAVELQRLLVPTPPFIDNDGTFVAGRNPDVGVISGMVQSFYDAPGVPVEDENGDYVQNEDGTYQVVKGTPFKEELAEINIATGLEYWYNNLIALRTGFFYEAPSKGNRQFFNAGVGLKYNNFIIDMSYLAAVGGRNSPLANTLRFTMRLKLGE